MNNQTITLELAAQPGKCKIKIGEHEIPYVTGIDIKARPDQLTEATIQIIADRVIVEPGYVTAQIHDAETGETFNAKWKHAHD